LIAWGVGACGGADNGSPGSSASGSPSAGLAGFGGVSAAGAPAPSGMLPGVAGSSAAGTGAGGRQAMGTGGVGGSTGSAGANGSAGSGAAMQGVDPSAIVLTALAANTTIGLDWSRVMGATGYVVYWSNAAGVTPQNGQAISVTEPAYVHRGLTNGMSYHYVVAAVLASGMGPASPEANATPSGEWVLEMLGSGDFDDVVTGARVPRVPIAQRVQVLLLPEGYLAAELPTFHDAASHDAGNNDVDRWTKEVFATDPYSRFKEAFVVWYLPRASNAHAGADTAFHVAISNGGVGDVTAAAQPLWSALDAQGSDAFAFAPGTTQPPNLVAAFLIFDSQQGRAGFSGLTTALRNPANASQNIRAAFALGQAHEFTHAFSRLSDEYIETGNMVQMGQQSETSNVAASNACGTLPWAHLLEGHGINDTPGLVGAFGTPAQGYHPEFRCQLNGTHDNGTAFCASGDERYTSLTLRSTNLCNFCREITTFRLFERTGLLSGTTSFETWKSMYRMPFYQRFGFFVPPGDVPETLMCNRADPPMPVFQACMP
jgi:hypothetical protein